MKKQDTFLFLLIGCMLSFCPALTGCADDVDSDDVDTDTQLQNDTASHQQNDTASHQQNDTGSQQPNDTGSQQPTDTGTCTGTGVDSTVIHVGHTQGTLEDVPDSAIELAKQNLHIVYQHTSHGSQLISGMEALMSYPAFGDLYTFSDDGSTGLDIDDYGIDAEVDDLSQGDSVDANGVTPWAVGTRALLDNPDNAHVNVVIWSWCSIDGHDAQRYVDNMEMLIAEYPHIQFVFMTGHSQGQGEDLTENGVHYNNQLIREHCRTHQRILYDFADIEAYNFEGEYFWSANMLDNLDYDGGNWGVEWIQNHPQDVFSLLTTGEGIDGFSGPASCAHSDSPTEARINCVKKAAAAWYLFARLAGWTPGS